MATIIPFKGIRPAADKAHMVVTRSADNYNKEILKQIEKSMLSIEFNQQYLAKFLKDGKLTNADLLDFYSGDEIRDKFKVIEKEISML